MPFIYVYPSAAITIEDVTPSTGVVGSSITITGRGFADGATVKFNNTPATGVNVISDTTITCTVPGLVRWTFDVTVTVPGFDPVVAEDAFRTLFPPTITDLSPSSGPVGTELVITGTNFHGGSQLYMSNTVMSGWQWEHTSPTSATLFSVPDFGLGPKNVFVYNIDGSSGQSLHYFTITV